MGKDKAKLEKPKEVEGEVKTGEHFRLPSEFNEEEVLIAMKQLGSKNITSTMIRDHFTLSNESGRGTTRRMMKKLEKAGKVKIHLKKDVKRRQYLYDVVESSGPKT